MIARGQSSENGVTPTRNWNRHTPSAQKSTAAAKKTHSLLKIYIKDMGNDLYTNMSTLDPDI